MKKSRKKEIEASEEIPIPKPRKAIFKHKYFKTALLVGFVFILTVPLNLLIGFLSYRTGLFHSGYSSQKEIEYVYISPTPTPIPTFTPTVTPSPLPNPEFNSPKTVLTIYTDESMFIVKNFKVTFSKKVAYDLDEADYYDMGYQSAVITDKKTFELLIAPYYESFLTQYDKEVLVGKNSLFGEIYRGTSYNSDGWTYYTTAGRGTVVEKESCTPYAYENLDPKGKIPCSFPGLLAKDVDGLYVTVSAIDDSGLAKADEIVKSIIAIKAE